MSKELKRSYIISDGDMLTESKTIFEFAKQDFKELQVVEPSLTLNEIESKIDEVDKCINDCSSLESRGCITIATLNLQSIMQKCRDEVQYFFFHCNRALPGIATVPIEFGRKGVDKARNNPEKMVSLLNLIITSYSKPAFEEKLDARLNKGYKDKLVEIKAQLIEAIEAKSLAKANRPAETKARILRFNAVWNFTRNISEIGKVAFRGSYAKQQQYNLYDTPGTKKKAEVPAKESPSAAQEE